MLKQTKEYLPWLTSETPLENTGLNGLGNESCKNGKMCNSNAVSASFTAVVLFYSGAFPTHDRKSAIFADDPIFRLEKVPGTSPRFSRAGGHVPTISPRWRRPCIISSMVEEHKPPIRYHAMGTIKGGLTQVQVATEPDIKIDVTTIMLWLSRY